MEASHHKVRGEVQRNMMRPIPLEEGRNCPSDLVVCSHYIVTQ